MAINMYDNPAEAKFIQTYVPIDFDNLWKFTAAAKDDYDKAKKALGDLKTNREEMSSRNQKLNENFSKLYDPIKEVTDKALQGEGLKDQSNQLLINSAINSFDYTKASNMKMNKTILDERAKQINDDFTPVQKEILSEGAFNASDESAWVRGEDVLQFNNPVPKFESQENAADEFFADIKANATDDGIMRVERLGWNDLNNVTKAKWNSIKEKPMMQLWIADWKESGILDNYAKDPAYIDQNTGEFLEDKALQHMVTQTQYDKIHRSENKTLPSGGYGSDEQTQEEGHIPFLELVNAKAEERRKASMLNIPEYKSIVESPDYKAAADNVTNTFNSIEEIGGDAIVNDYENKKSLIDISNNRKNYLRKEIEKYATLSVEDKQRQKRVYEDNAKELKELKEKDIEYIEALKESERQLMSIPGLKERYDKHITAKNQYSQLQEKADNVIRKNIDDKLKKLFDLNNIKLEHITTLSEGSINELENLLGGDIGVAATTRWLEAANAKADRTLSVYKNLQTDEEKNPIIKEFTQKGYYLENVALVPRSVAVIESSVNAAYSSDLKKFKGTGVQTLLDVLADKKISAIFIPTGESIGVPKQGSAKAAGKAVVRKADLLSQKGITDGILNSAERQGLISPVTIGGEIKYYEIKQAYTPVWYQGGAGAEAALIEDAWKKETPANLEKRNVDQVYIP